ncbi:DUF4240 domain-containing protein [Nonomuraea longicatena]|uniref:DUF4240 domain-containing protein n=1 Tax=Nonomuraea longicatena TaxID=83682 RepID=A0ABP3ZX73_9ACTN
MDLDGFWELVERSAEETGSRSARLEWLARRLSALPAEEIVDYECWFTRCADRACTWDVYAACWAVNSSWSSDGYEYFVRWLISLGRADFEKIVTCPDLVFELPQIRHVVELKRTYAHKRTTWSADGGFRLDRVTHTRRQRVPDEVYPEFEAFAYVPYEVYEARGLDPADLYEAVAARGVYSKFPFLSNYAHPDGERWDYGDETEFRRRLPRIARQLGMFDISPDPSEKERGALEITMCPPLG